MNQKKNSQIFPKVKRTKNQFLKSFLSFLLFKQFLSSSSPTLFQVSVLFVPNIERKSFYSNIVNSLNYNQTNAILECTRLHFISIV